MQSKRSRKKSSRKAAPVRTKLSPEVSRPREAGLSAEIAPGARTAKVASAPSRTEARSSGRATKKASAKRPAAAAKSAIQASKPAPPSEVEVVEVRETPAPAGVAELVEIVETASVVGPKKRAARSSRPAGTQAVKPVGAAPPEDAPAPPESVAAPPVQDGAASWAPGGELAKLAVALTPAEAQVEPAAVPMAKPVVAPPKPVAAAPKPTSPASAKPIPAPPKPTSPAPTMPIAAPPKPASPPSAKPIAAAPTKPAAKPGQTSSKLIGASAAAVVAAGSPVKTAIPVKATVPVTTPISRLPLPIILGQAPLEVLRPDDLLSFYLNFVNLRLDTSNTRAPKLVIDDTSNPAYLVVWFAPQSILEEAYFETAAKITTNPGFDSQVPPLQTTNDTIAAPGSVPAYLAGQSRLVFQVPQRVSGIPYTIEGLLDWSDLNLVVSPVALGTPLPPPITAPTFLQTAIEIPWRIVLSPGKGVGWAHPSEPETFAGRTALWHTRLGSIKTVTSGKTTQQVLDEASDTNTIPLRAIWSDDFTDHGKLPLLGDEKPFRSSLDPHDRMQIVILTAGTLGYTIPGTFGPGIPWTPQPIQASRLFLSALGGYLSSRGSWSLLPSYTDTTGAPQALDLIEWNHQATMGRDQYVRVVYTGYLYPFGNAASLIKVTERKIVPPDGGTVTQTTAYLRQHMYIVVREPEKTYGSEPYTYGRREMPFWQSVRLKTTVTPDIDIPVMLTGDGNAHQSFWVTVGGGQYFQFHVEATDLNGSTIDFLAPLVFMSDSEGFPGGVQSIYAGNDAVRVCTLKGQKVAYADPSAGDTILRTTELYFTSELLLTQPPYPIAPFIPSLDKATVTVPAVEQILGTSSPLTVQLYTGYLQNGLDTNAGVYAQIAGTQPQIAFSASQSGGFSTPTLTMTSLSARKGLVAGKADDAAAGNFNPAEFFDLSAKLFGTVPLQKLIPVNGQNFASAAQNAPEIRTILQPNSKAPTSMVTRIQWSPQLQNYQQDPVRVLFNQNGLSSALTLKASLTRNMTGGQPTSEITGQMTNFQLVLLGVIALTMNSLKFTSKNGQKMIVVATLPNNSPITFTGALSFLQTLADILPPGIFGGKGPSIDLEASQIVVSYTLGLPPVGIGVFSLENISITAGLDLPYLDGQPGFEFAFAKRSSPFLLTVECLGGGGFVHLIVNASGVQLVEASLEFGGEFSLDLGVASGSVHAMAGIYFKLTGTSTTVTGFVDIGGEVSVLGIISISLDLNLSLTYEVSNGKSMIQGRATMTVSVSVLFFSVSVSISVEKSFGSDPGDPRIESMLTAQDWSEYAAAFA